MKIRRVLALLFAMLLIALPALAVTTLDKTDDFYVNDDASVFDDRTIGHIVLNNDVLYDACGAQIVFVTIDEVSTTTLENYCYSLFKNWGIGSEEKNNGIVVLMSIKDDDYWAMQGTGLQDYITSGDLDEMLYTYLEPYFAKKQYAQGAVALFDKLFEAVADVYKLDIKPDATLYDKYIAQFDNYEGDYYTKRNAHDDTGDMILGLIVFIIIIILVVRIPVRRVYRRRHPYVYVGRPGFGYRRPPMGGGYRSGGYSSRPSGGYSSSRSSGGFSSSRSSGSFGGGRSGGGGSSRGGGAGRHR